MMHLNLFTQQLHFWRYALVILVSVICVTGVLRMVELVSSASAHLSLAKGVEYQIPANNPDIQQVRQSRADEWLVEQSDLLSFGMDNQVYWFRTTLPALEKNGDWLLELDYGLLDDIQLWIDQGGQNLAFYHTGDTLPFAQRPVLHEKFIFPLPDSDQPLTLYIRVKTDGALKLPMYIWRSDKFAVFNGEHNIVMGLFFGFITAMALSNFFFFITSRSLSFLVYSGYAISLGLTLMSLHGLGYKYLWPDNTWLQGRSIAIFANLTMLCATQFSVYMLNVASFSPITDKILRWLTGFFGLMTLAALIVPYNLFIRITLLCLIITLVFIYCVAIIRSIRGDRIARLYTLAWTTLLASGFIASLENLNLVDINFNSQYLLMLGGSIETLLLALVLAMSYTQQREDKLQAQQKALEQEIQLREAREETLAVQEEAQHDLEYKVQERTLELEIALRELHEVNRELEEKNTQDALTGIRNRRHFDKRYLAEVRRSRREQTPLTVAMLDIDYFKKINDTEGHLTGDECIRHVAQLIRQAVKRPTDDVCRYGGEEFAILLPNTERSGAEQLLESIRTSIEQTPVIVGGKELHVTVSIGYSADVVALKAPDDYLIRAADAALYDAKNAGRNRIAWQIAAPYIAQESS